MNIDPKLESPLARSIQLVVMFCAAILFGISLYFGISQFLERNWWLALISIVLALMAIPFADQTFNIKAKIGASLIMPFALFGLILNVGLYLLLFHFQWFSDIFNNKSGGPLGLIVFALTGLCIGGFGGFHVVRLTGLFDETEEKPQQKVVKTVDEKNHSRDPK